METIIHFIIFLTAVIEIKFNSSKMLYIIV